MQDKVLKELDNIEEGIGIGFWVDGFGTVDMYYYADGECLELTEEKKKYVELQAVRTIRRLFLALEKEEI